MNGVCVLEGESNYGRRRRDLGGVSPKIVGLECGWGARSIGDDRCGIMLLGKGMILGSWLVGKKRRGLLMGQLRSPGHLVDGVRFVSLRAPLVRVVSLVVDGRRGFGGVDAAGNRWRFILTTMVFRVERVCSLS